MLVLLQYNESDVRTVQQLFDCTQIMMATLVQVLQLLIKVRLLVVEGTSPSNTALTTPQDAVLEPATKLRLYQQYKNKKLRLNINVPLKTETKVDTDKTNTQIAEDRSMAIQAAIVRVMKMRRTLKQSLLVAEVISLLSPRFKPDIQVIKVGTESS